MIFRRALGFAVLAVSLTALAVGCHRSPPSVAASKPPEVFISNPIYSDNVQDYEDFPGRTEGFKKVEVRARVSGQLTAIHFDDGADVKVGDPLFDIDPRPFELEVLRTQATIKQADANLQLKKAQYSRAQELRSRTPPSISKEDLEVAKSDMEAAQATRDLAVANEKIAALNLSFCHITSEINGRASRRNLDVGNQVMANVTPLTTVITLDPIYANFYVDERTVIRVRDMIRKRLVTSGREKTIKVKVALANEEEGQFSLEGVIDSADNSLDAGTGTLPVRVRLENPAIPKGFLLSPNMFVRIRFPVGDAHCALMVPEEALVSDQGIRHLYVLDADDKVVYRKVKLGLQQGEMRVIEDGVSPTDRVIVSGLQRVRQGIKVTAKLSEKKEPSGD
jgi:RND family efflux transporter MFP subunit